MACIICNLLQLVNEILGLFGSWLWSTRLAQKCQVTRLTLEILGCQQDGPKVIFLNELPYLRCDSSAVKACYMSIDVLQTVYTTHPS